MEPEQVVGVSYWPLELQVRTSFPLHVDVPGVQAWQVPVELHVPPEQELPEALGA